MENVNTWKTVIVILSTYDSICLTIPSIEHKISPRLFAWTSWLDTPYLHLNFPFCIISPSSSKLFPAYNNFSLDLFFSSYLSHNPFTQICFWNVCTVCSTLWVQNHHLCSLLSGWKNSIRADVSSRQTCLYHRDIAILPYHHTTIMPYRPQRV